MGLLPSHVLTRGRTLTGGLTLVFGVRRARMIRELIEGGIWVALGMGLARAAGFVTNLLLARVFGPGWLGQYALVMANVNLFDLFASAGVQKSATRLVAEGRADSRRQQQVIEALLRHAILGGVVISAVFALCAAPIARSVYRLPELVGAMMLASPLVLLHALLFALRGMLAGWSDFRALSLNTSLQGVLGAGLIASGALVAGIGGAVFGNVVTCVMSVVVLYRFASRKAEGIRPRLTAHAPEVTLEIRRLTTPIFLAAMAAYPVSYATLALVARHPGGDVEAGLFQAALGAKYAMTMVAGALASSFLPRYLAGRQVSRERWEAANSGLAIALAVATGAPFLLFPEVLGWLFGPGFQEPAFAEVVALVAASYGITLLKDAPQRRLLATDAMGWFARTNVLWGVCALTGVYLTSTHGALSLAGSYLAADVAHLWLLVIGERWRHGPRDASRVEWLLLAGSVVILVLVGTTLVGWGGTSARAGALVVVGGALTAGGAVCARRMANQR